MSVELRLRGIGPWLVTEYLKELDAREVQPGRLLGQGWQAEVSPAAPVWVGSCCLGVTEVRFTGSEGTMARAVETFKRKALRAGG